MRLLLLLLSLPALAQLLPQDATVTAADAGPDGFIYVAGQLAYHGFVAKLAPTGDSILWTTTFGGEATDLVRALAVAPDGSVIVAGNTTSRSFQPALSGYQKAPAGVFLLRLGPDGQPTAGTFFGGADADAVNALQLDAAGNVYIAGAAFSDPFPTTPGAFRRDRNRDTTDLHCGIGADQFVAKLDPTLGTLVFSTLIGLPGPDQANALALGADTSVYVIGTEGQERNTNCRAEAVVTHLSPDASLAIYSVELPSAYGGYAVAVDELGFAYAASDSRAVRTGVGGDIWKLDALGGVLAHGSIAGSVAQIVPQQNAVVVTGSASPSLLTATPGAAGPCITPGTSPAIPYVAAFSLATLANSYRAYWNGTGLWPASAGRAIVSRPYTTAQPFAALPAALVPAGAITCSTNSARVLSDAIAPGELVSLYGLGIGPATAVRVAGLPAPLLYSGATQINFVTPFGLPDDGTVRIEVLRNGTVTAAFDKPLTAVALGLFGAVNQDGTLNTKSSPARPGTVIALWGTGFGAMSPQPVDGSRPDRPVCQPVAAFNAFVGGRAATIEYIGNAPTLVQGLVQINVRLPDGILSDSTVRLTSGDASVEGTIYVR